jgi:hypothetical protein
MLYGTYIKSETNFNLLRKVHQGIPLGHFFTNILSLRLIICIIIAHYLAQYTEHTKLIISIPGSGCLPLRGIWVE